MQISSDDMMQRSISAPFARPSARPGRRRFLGVAVALATLAAGLVVSVAAPQPVVAAAPVGTHGNRLVSETAPVSWTPHVEDGYVDAIAEVGDLVIVGGNFSSVRNPSQTEQFTRNFIFAFHKGTGAISTTFVPQLNGEVRSIVPSGDGETVFVAGGFNVVNGQTNRSVAKLNVNTGQRVAAFQGAVLNGRVQDLALRGDRLYVTGRFTTVANQPSPLVTALDPVTGAAVPGVNIDISVPRPNRPDSILSISASDVSPDGSRMVIVGNFTVIAGQPRYQIGMIDLTTSPISVADWRTTQYDDSCSSSFWTYMSDVEFSPDGSFFVAVTTGAFSGGYAARTLCDSSARWETYATGSNLLPTWVNYTGGDTLLATAISDTVVYQGGHERRINNPYGQDRPGRGSVWVEGISAVDHRGGAPQSWDPGRDRGVGVHVLKVTDEGLWVGSDTTRIARWNYRARLAFLPLSSGWDKPADYTGTLPGTVYSFGSDTGSTTQQDQLIARSVVAEPDHLSVLSSEVRTTAAQLRNVRGAFMVDGKLYTAWEENGVRTFRVQTFDGQNFGTPEVIDLRLLDSNNPTGCTSVPNDDIAPGTHSCNQINSTTPPNIPNFGNFDIPNARGMFYDSVTGRLYYNSPQYTWSSNGTRTSQADLAYRSFSTESNILGPVRYEGGANIPGLNWNNVRSMFLVGSHLYIGDTTGNLTRWEFDHWGGVPKAGTNVIVSGPAVGDGQNWRARDSFVYVGVGEAPPNVAPTAVASVNCVAATCTFDGSSSTDSDGTIATYAWDFGDGTDPVVTTEPTVTRNYLTDGEYAVTLTVTDDDAATATTSTTASVVIPNVAPTAVIGVTGTGLEYSFGAASSVDPDGSIVSYTWDFGDGTDPVTVGGPEPVAHEYAAAGPYTVTLTVTDNDGDSGEAQTSVNAFDPTAVPTVDLRGVASVNVNSSQPQVVIPASVEAGDVLVLVATANSSTSVMTGPAGWALLDSRVDGTATATTAAWTKTATAGDAGSAVQVGMSVATKVSLQVVGYSSSVPASASVGAFAVDIDTVSNTVRTTPTLSASVPGSVLLSYWADKSSDNTGWTLPAAVTLLDSSVGSGNGRVVAALGQSGPLAPGTVGGHSATSQGTANRRGVTWSILIQPPAP